MNTGIVLIMTAFLSDGTIVTSPAFDQPSMDACMARGARIVVQYRGVDEVNKMTYKCYVRKESLIIDPTKCQE
jgi:hypothetical protein